MALVGTITEVTVGTAVPSNADGFDGSIYFRVSGGTVLSVWKKDSGAWALVGDIIPAGWVSFNPAATAETGTITSLFGQDGAYKIIGDTVFVWAYATINNAGTGGGALRFGLPSAIWLPAGAAFFGQVLHARVFDNSGGSPNKTGMAFFVPGGGGSYDRLSCYRYDGATPIFAGNGIYLSGSYQKA